VDLVAPIPVLSTGAGSLVNGAISVSVNTGEATTNFVSTDISPTTATVSNFTGSGSSYSFTLTPAANGAFSATINAGAYTDSAGNPNAAGNSAGSTYDGTAPTPALSTSAGAAVNGPITVNVNTGEVTSDFTSGDVTATNASVSGFSGSGSSYSFTLTPSSEGAFSATVSAGTYSDAATNTNLAGNTVGSIYDVSAPTPTLSTSAGSYVNGAISVTINAGESTTNLTAGDVTPTNATVSGFSGSGSSYSFTLTPISEGAFSATVNAGTYTDAATNSNLAGNSVGSILDLTAPTSSASAGDPTQAGHTTLTVGFTASDSGAGVASTKLYAKGPSDGSFVDTGLTQTGTSGSFSYPVSQGNGSYQFATAAADSVGNAQGAPSSAQGSVLLNVVENGPFTQTVVSGNDSLPFPMTDTLNVNITFNTATVGQTVTVQRNTPITAPAHFQHSNELLNESLTITKSVGLSFSSADLDWMYDTGATIPPGGISTVYQFDTNPTPTNTYPVTPVSGHLFVNGITSFSDWYAGNAVAVPVAVSEFSIE
jgi:hypothetical protein